MSYSKCVVPRWLTNVNTTINKMINFRNIEPWPPLKLVDNNINSEEDLAFAIFV